MIHTELTREILGILNLPVSKEGLLKAHKITRTTEVMETLRTDGEWEGTADSERAEREILAKVLKETPQLTPLVLRLKNQGLWEICSTLDWFLEKTEQLAGNRPLPEITLQIRGNPAFGVNVMNLSGKNPSYGFLFWEEGKCLIGIKEEVPFHCHDDWPGSLGEEQQAYKNSFEAAMDGWLVD